MNKEFVEIVSSVIIALFAILQWYISTRQVKNELKFKRLELADKLDEAWIKATGEHRTIYYLQEQLILHQSLYLSLLKEKDRKIYEDLLNLVENLRKKDKYNITPADIKKINDSIFQLNSVLCDADYPLQKINENSYINRIKQSIKKWLKN